MPMSMYIYKCIHAYIHIHIYIYIYIFLSSTTYIQAVIQLYRMEKEMRMPGVEPGSQAWEACMMPLHYMRGGSNFDCNRSSQR